jgi:hypothetical protein
MRAKDKPAIKSGNQASPTYATQKRHPDRGIKYDRGALRYFTWRTIAVGSAATIVGQIRIHPHPTATAMES